MVQGTGTQLEILTAHDVSKVTSETFVNWTEIHNLIRKRTIALKTADAIKVARKREYHLKHLQWNYLLTVSAASAPSGSDGDVSSRLHDYAIDYTAAIVSAASAPSGSDGDVSLILPDYAIDSAALSLAPIDADKDDEIAAVMAGATLRALRESVLGRERVLDGGRHCSNETS